MRAMKSIAIFQILLILSLSIIIPMSFRSFSSSGIVYVEVNLNEDGKDSPNKLKLLKELLTSFMPTVEAQDPPKLFCCERTKSGAICQTAGEEQCDKDYKFVSKRCEETSFCAVGCCAKESGVCTENAPASSCQLGRGTFFTGKSCDEINFCLKGCCIIGDQYVFTTDSRCRLLAQDFGVSNPEYRVDITSEAACIALRDQDAEGCCVIGGSFQFTTQRDCSTKRGDFNEGMLCSNSALDSRCERQETTACAEGKDEVYWFDSCGNRENIYDSNKDRSWNNGRVLQKEQSCNAKSNNVNNPNCGNCNFLGSSVCGRADSTTASPRFGEYICKDLTCRDTIEKDGKPGRRKTGESWCVYDSETGQGQDVVGSRHWRALCINGEQIIEPCSDQRQEVCVEGSVKVGETTFTEAACLTNRWRECLGVQEQEACESNSGCFWFDAPNQNWVGFRNNTCVPRTPPGLDVSSLLNGDQGLGSATGAALVCGQGSFACKVKMKSGGLFTTGGCRSNCECITDKWREAMNDRCMALGDCGASINLAGEFTRDGYGIYGKKLKKGLTIEKLLASATKRELREGYLNSLKDVFILPLEKEDFPGVNVVGGVIGITGFVGIGGYEDADKGTGKLGLAEQIHKGMLRIFSGNALYVEYAYAAMVFFVMKSFGVDDLVAGIIIGAYLLIEVVHRFVGNLAAQLLPGFGALGPFIILVILAIIFGGAFEDILEGISNFLFGSEYYILEYFSCQPTLPPEGGDNCELCNQDSRRPCSEYRCLSLGTTCELVNKGTSGELCVSIGDDDILSPRIVSADTSTTKHEVRFVEGRSVRLQKAGGGCLEPFNSVELTLITDEAAQCKIDFERTSSFDEMTFLYGGVNFYRTKHSQSFTPPGNPLGEEWGGFTPGTENTFYVRCKDKPGNANVNEFLINFCVDPSPDRTAPRIVETIPDNGAFIPFETSTQHTKIFTNEPADCKWDKTDVSYDVMLNDFSCQNRLDQSQPNSLWLCEEDLTNLDQGANTFYIRCKDLPFSNGTRNVNIQSYVYTLNVADELLITSVQPQGEIAFGARGQPITFEVETSGGVGEGRAFCFYSFSGFGLDERIFSETGSKMHVSKLTLDEGSHTFYIRCQDFAGNEARKQTSLTVTVDRSPPELVRVFTAGGSLFIITDEVTSCKYSDNQFVFGDGVVLEPDNSDTHSASLSELPASMYLRCRDGFGNEMQRIIRPFS